MEHNRPKVVDCDYYEEGYYAGFFENGGSLLMCDTWVSCQDTRNAIKDLTIVSASFGVQTERDKVPEILARLFNTAHPFANKKRFDTNNSFFNFSRGSFSSYITQMSSAASWKERIKEKQEGSGKHTETDHKWSYDDAQVAFAKGLRSLMNAVNSKTSLYDTFKFEREFNMIWCCGPEKCLKPKPCNEVCTVPTIPPDQPGSGKPDKPLEYPSGKVLKAAFSAKGLDPSKYHIHADRLDKFDCYIHDHEQIRVNELSDSIKLHARIILCFTEKDETEEACGQLGRRIWTYDSSNKTFEKHFYSFPEGEEEF